MYTITYKFEQKGIAPVTVSNIQPRQNLLEIALVHNIKLQHTCGGIGACSSCHVYVENGEEFLEGITDKEEDYIDRAISPRLNSRLCCRCILQPGNGVVTVVLPDQSRGG